MEAPERPRPRTSRRRRSPAPSRPAQSCGVGRRCRCRTRPGLPWRRASRRPAAGFRQEGSRGDCIRVLTHIQFVTWTAPRCPQTRSTVRRRRTRWQARSERSGMRRRRFCDASLICFRDRASVATYGPMRTPSKRHAHADGRSSHSGGARYQGTPGAGSRLCRVAEGTNFFAVLDCPWCGTRHGGFRLEHQWVARSVNNGRKPTPWQRLKTDPPCGPPGRDAPRAEQAWPGGRAEGPVQLWSMSAGRGRVATSLSRRR